MRSLHVWLLTGVLAAAACKPAVRESSTLQSSQDAERDERLRQILIGAGGVGVGALAVFLGVKGPKSVWTTIKESPKKSALWLQRGIGDVGSFVTRSNRVTRSQFDNVFKKAEWEKDLGLPYDSKAKSALLDFLSVKRADAIDAVKGGKSVDDALNDDTLRVMNKEDLTKSLHEIYGDDKAELVEAMIKKVDEHKDLHPAKLRKKLEKTANNLNKVDDATQEAS